MTKPPLCLAERFTFPAGVPIIQFVMDETKRHYLPGLPPGLNPGLWVVATPIGNLSDLSPRARAALEHAHAILCEDTRRTARLTAVLGIQKRLERLDSHASPARIAEIVQRLVAGESFAVVTDAGTPGISDPAAVLVSAARAQGICITPVPGPSAVTALLSVAGFAETAFTFGGFFPRKAGDRQRLIEAAQACSLARVYLWFESPERISESLAQLATSAPSARVIAAKELSKLHERVFWGEAPQVSTNVSDEIAREGALGEWCFAVEFREDQQETLTTANSLEWVKALHCLLDASVSASEAAKRVSQHFGAPKREVYERALQLLGKKSARGD